MAVGISNLALLHHSQGAYDEARPLFERALKMGEKAFGPEHPHVALSANNLALLTQRPGSLRRGPVRSTSARSRSTRRLSAPSIPP